jgi:hypothetical protein
MEQAGVAAQPAPMETARLEAAMPLLITVAVAAVQMTMATPEWTIARV